MNASRLIGLSSPDFPALACFRDFFRRHCFANIGVVECDSNSHEGRASRGAGKLRGMNPIRRQIAAIPFLVRNGKVEVLLQTSRGTRRWIIPKGNIEPGQTPEDAALAEAYEEAGVSGVVHGDLPIGFFNYLKQTASGGLHPVMVEVFLMRVTRILGDWPERADRERRWVSLADAARLVEEPSIAPLFERLAELEQVLIAEAAEPADGLE